MTQVIDKLSKLYDYAQSTDGEHLGSNHFVWVEVGDLYEALRISDEGDFFRVLLGYREGSSEHYVGAVTAADFNKATGLAHKTTEVKHRAAYSEEPCPRGAWRSVTRPLEETFIEMPEGVNLETSQLVPVYQPAQAESVFTKMRMKIDYAFSIIS
ncbi:MAG: hypothetical protein AAF988_01065 [Pseudomonadota bacterium]